MKAHVVKEGVGTKFLTPSAPITREAAIPASSPVHMLDPCKTAGLVLGRLHERLLEVHVDPVARLHALIEDWLEQTESRYRRE